MVALIPHYYCFAPCSRRLFVISVFPLFNLLLYTCLSLSMFSWLHHAMKNPADLTRHASSADPSNLFALLICGSPSQFTPITTAPALCSNFLSIYSG